MAPEACDDEQDAQALREMLVERLQNLMRGTGARASFDVTRVLEHVTENQGVGSSILPWATR